MLAARLTDADFDAVWRKIQGSEVGGLTFNWLGNCWYKDTTGDVVWETKVYYDGVKYLLFFSSFFLET